jgi:hypothetical protein
VTKARRLTLTGVGVEKLVPAKSAKIKSQGCPTDDFLSFPRHYSIPPILAILKKMEFFNPLAITLTTRLLMKCCGAVGSPKCRGVYSQIRELARCTVESAN